MNKDFIVPGGGVEYKEIVTAAGEKNVFSRTSCFSKKIAQVKNINGTLDFEYIRVFISSGFSSFTVTALKKCKVKMYSSHALPFSEDFTTVVEKNVDAGEIILTVPSTSTYFTFTIFVL